jgi:hypothetical protein
MNKTFADHVTNVAFFLSISKKQTLMLMHLFNNPWDESRSRTSTQPYYSFEINGTRDTWIITYSALERKGLVERIVCQEMFREKLIDWGYWRLTEAGRLTCLLLIEAGLGAAKQPQEQAA